MIDDTIVAISTAVSTNAIGIIRISGKNSISIIDKIFRSKTEKKLSKVSSHTINYGYIYDNNINEDIDEVLVMVMRGPRSFTKEDIIEINCHGGIIVIKKIMNLILNHGARLAEPGEFTKRAFLNGRIDLSQAEAVMDIINAKTDLSLKSSMNQLEGTLSKKINKLRDKVLNLLGHIEAAIDYPEYDIEHITMEKIKDGTEEIVDEVKYLIKTADSGKLLKEGIETVIVGKPNVGKSSLLNSLIRQQKAIVTDIPGTTRDIIEEYINIGGIPLKIIDTAGIRNTEDVVEQIGVKKSKEVIEKSDLIIMMIDASQKLSEEDEEIIELIEDKKYIVLLNKADLNKNIDESYIRDKFNSKKIIYTSVKESIGIDKLENTIKEMFTEGNISLDNSILVTNVRHKNSLDKAYTSLNIVLESIEMNMPEDCLAIDLKNCYESLGEITGNSLNEDIINNIFSQFCLGK